MFAAFADAAPNRVAKNYTTMFVYNDDVEFIKYGADIASITFELDPTN